MGIPQYGPPMIPIPRASDDLILSLVKAGILELTVDGIKCVEEKENRPS